MSITILGLQEKPVPAKSFVFSGGELQTQVPGLESLNKVPLNIQVLARMQSAQDIIELMLAHEVLQRLNPKGNKKLIVPYFPYARQDRVMQDCEAFSLKVIAKIINDLKFDEVVACDVHSDVTAAIVERIRVVSQFDLITIHNVPFDSWIENNKPLIVSPDAGAYKKALKIANNYESRLVVGSKIRNNVTGEITGTMIDSDVRDQNCLIVDDICDGGRTFIELAKVLREKGAKTIVLYVTHGIFSKGYDVFKGLIDRIYTTDTFLPKTYPLPETDVVPLFVKPLDYRYI